MVYNYVEVSRRKPGPHNVRSKVTEGIYISGYDHFQNHIHGTSWDIDICTFHRY